MTVDALELNLSQDDVSLIVAFAACSLDEKPGSNWVQEAGGLPNYICRVAKHIKASGKPTGTAIAMAISQIRKWAATGSAATKAKAAKALAEWEALKAKSKAKSAAKKVAATRFDGSTHEYDLISLCAQEYNVDTVRRAFEDRERKKREVARKARQAAAGTDPYTESPTLDYPYRYIREQWTTFLVVEEEGKRNKYSRIPFSVHPKSGEVIFGKEIPVELQYVAKDGSTELDEKDLEKLMQATSFTDRVSELSDVLALTRVRGHFRHIDGKRVWIPPFDDKRRSGRMDTPGQTAKKVAKSDPKKAAQLRQQAKKTAAPVPKRKPFNPLDQSKDAPQKSEDSGHPKPGTYRAGSGGRVGRAHMIVKDDGTGVYVNSRGDEKPLSKAQVQRNFSAGMKNFTAGSGTGDKPAPSNEGKNTNQKSTSAGASLSPAQQRIKTAQKNAPAVGTRVNTPDGPGKVTSVTDKVAGDGTAYVEVELDKPKQVGTMSAKKVQYPHSKFTKDQSTPAPLPGARNPAKSSRDLSKLDPEMQRKVREASAPQSLKAPSTEKEMDQESRMLAEELPRGETVREVLETRQIELEDLEAAEKNHKGSGRPYITVKPPGGTEISVTTDLARRELGLPYRKDDGPKQQTATDRIARAAGSNDKQRSLNDQLDPTEKRKLSGMLRPRAKASGRAALLRKASNDDIQRFYDSAKNSFLHNQDPENIGPWESILKALEKEMERRGMEKKSSARYTGQN